MTSTSEQKKSGVASGKGCGEKRGERAKEWALLFAPVVSPSPSSFDPETSERRVESGEWRHTQCGLGTADTFTFNLSSLTATGRSVPRTQNVQSAMPNVNPQSSPLYANGNRLQLSLWALGTNCVSPKKLSVCLQSFAARLLSRVCKARYHHCDLPC